MRNIKNFELDRRTLVRGLVGGVATSAFGLSSGKAFAACIGGNSGFTGSRGNWRIFQNALPPSDNTIQSAAFYNYFPATDVFSWEQDVNETLNTSTWTGGKTWMYVWANRANSPDRTRFPHLSVALKLNPISALPPYSSNNLECRVEYSSIARANAATLSHIRYLLGRTDYQQPWLDVGGSANDFFTLFRAYRQS